MNRKISKLLFIIGFLFVLLFVIPMLTAFLAVHFPLADLITGSQKHFPGYSNTEKSFFFTADEASAQKDFEDIAYYFENVDWEEEILPIISALNKVRSKECTGSDCILYKYWIRMPISEKGERV